MPSDATEKQKTAAAAIDELLIQLVDQAAPQTQIDAATNAQYSARAAVNYLEAAGL